jgi:hypothetical protein
LPSKSTRRQVDVELCIALGLPGRGRGVAAEADHQRSALDDGDRLLTAILGENFDLGFHSIGHPHRESSLGVGLGEAIAAVSGNGHHLLRCQRLPFRSDQLAADFMCRHHLNGGQLKPLDAGGHLVGFRPRFTQLLIVVGQDDDVCSDRAGEDAALITPLLIRDDLFVLPEAAVTERDLGVGDRLTVVLGEHLAMNFHRRQQRDFQPQGLAGGHEEIVRQLRPNGHS